MLTEIYCDVDDFVKELKNFYESNSLVEKGYSKVRQPELSISEIMTIIIYFHFSKYRTFKDYYLNYEELAKAFPKLCSYNRFIELEKFAFVPLALFLKTQRMGKVSGISFVDSTSIKVCHNKRINRNKVFKNIAQRGKTSMGWFYGFKLHLIINDQGEITSFAITPGNMDDRNKALFEKLTRGLFGKLFGDRGYISKELFESLLGKGVQLITTLKKNMKNKLMPFMDKILLRKRCIIETINDQLKNICQIEHTRHRNPLNFLTNLIAGLITYSYFTKKPSLDLFRNKGMSNLLIDNRF